MVTADERREVAERLRDLQHMTYYAEETLENIKDAIGLADTTNTFREPEDVYEVLADLIDPTCHQVIEDETQVCSECSGDLDEGYGWDFCPHCGARVVDFDG
nr:hypothetical protein [uncultured Olsenella sp.]